MEINDANRWMEIYQVDSAIQRLNNWGQKFSFEAAVTQIINFFSNTVTFNIVTQGTVFMYT